MFDDLDPRSPTPLYEQIAARVRIAVAAGELEGGEALPSVRKLAARLRVNPATVVQAYRDLEAEGFVERRQGAGTFVRPLELERKTSERRTQARRLARQALERAARLGIPAQEVLNAMQSELDGGGA